LIDGVERLPIATRQQHLHYLLELQNLDGGFPDREGSSDLYYTGFALRSLALLQGLSPQLGERTAGYLRDRMMGSAGVVDFFSLIVSCSLVPLGGGPDLLADAPADWRERAAQTLESFRTADGGYGKTPQARFGSTYTSFLVLLCLQLLDRPVPDADQLVEFIKSRRRSDGGFVEISAMKRSGANPTAAAIGTLQILGQIEESTRLATIQFLAGLSSTLEGGLRANDRIPSADLLSTFTACWTLDQLEGTPRLDWPLVQSYVQKCENPFGGFHGGLWDERADAEYTFYGLGTLALSALLLE